MSEQLPIIRIVGWTRINRRRCTTMLIVTNYEGGVYTARPATAEEYAAEHQRQLERVRMAEVKLSPSPPP